MHLCIRYSTIETKEAVRIGYNRMSSQTFISVTRAEKATRYIQYGQLLLFE